MILFIILFAFLAAKINSIKIFPRFTKMKISENEVIKKYVRIEINVKNRSLFLLPQVE